MATTSDLLSMVRGMGADAVQASRVLAGTSAAHKNTALNAMANQIWANRETIFAANADDVRAARDVLGDDPKVDRLQLSEPRLQAIVEGILQIVDLQDPIGEVIEAFNRPNGLHIEKIRVPMGVIAVVYESRPNVTVDSAALCLKTGNAVILRGGREALRSNLALVEAIQHGLRSVGLPDKAVQLIEVTDRETVDLLIQATDFIDLAIPRGGASLIRRVKDNARVPVIETGVGNCHVYVDAKANLHMAKDIVVNAKTQRPSVCNAAESLLIHRGIAETQTEWVRDLFDTLHQAGVELRVCGATVSVLEAYSGAPAYLKLATESDWGEEYLALVLSAKLVDDVDEAIVHVTRYGTKHSESIVTDDDDAAERFLSQVDAAAVYHNASTRFTDGFEFGYGAEIGISTQKLHARGPMGLRELTSYKYVVRGTGQIRP